MCPSCAANVGGRGVRTGGIHGDGGRLPGVLVNGLATIPFLSIQARGRSDLTALANVFELPLFIGAIYLMTREWGVTGAAMAWTLRVAIDLVALQWMSARLRSDAVTRSDCRVALVVAALAGVAFALAFLEPTSLRALGSIGAGTASMALIAYTHRDTLRTMLRARSV